MDIARRVGPTARLRLYEDAGHSLDEVAVEVLQEVEAFVAQALAGN